MQAHLRVLSGTRPLNGRLFEGFRADVRGAYVPLAGFRLLLSGQALLSRHWVISGRCAARGVTKMRTQLVVSKTRRDFWRESREAVKWWKWPVLHLQHDSFDFLPFTIAF